jgi:hypothetical protein
VSGRPGDPDVRDLLARAVADVTPDPHVHADLERGRAALGRRRSVLATLAVGVGTALVVAGAVTLPERLGPATGADPVASGGFRETPSTAPATGLADLPTGGLALAAVPLEPATAGQHAEHVVATLLPRGWSLVDADEESLRVADGATGDDLEVVPSPFPGSPPVMRGVGDFERLGGTHVSYYWVEESGGAPRPTMVFELTYGRWAQVSAPPRLGWGMAELSAFAAGLRAPFSCEEPCEVPLSP